MGLMDIRLLTTGMPYLSPTSLQVPTRFLRKPEDAVADALLESLDVVSGAFKQVDAQCDGSDVQMLVSEHFKCGKNLSLG